MSLLNVGARALLANQAALQTTGHNIANVNTAGYSRQSVVLQTVQGQFTGGGYIGKGVDVQTVLRNHSELLTRQSTAAAAVDAGDSVRAERLRQLQDVFAGGTAGLGAAINDMMNAFSDVVSAPTDLTARSVVLTRMDETAQRLRGASDRLDEIGYTVAEQLQGSMKSINALARNIAGMNEQVVRAKGNGQPANDLLDQRDQLIRQLNEHIQTSQVAADDGSIGLFVGGSQPLVLGSKAATLAVGDPLGFGAGGGQKHVFFQQAGAATQVELHEGMLGGGTAAGLLRFQNHDLAEGRNLLGRMAVGISETLNAQNRLGLTLDGKPGENLFAPIALGTALAGRGNSTPAVAMGLAVADASRLQASSYSIAFTGANAGAVTRQSDGKVMAFDASATPPVTLDAVMRGEGLRLTDGATGPFAGANAPDTFQLNPLLGAAAQMQALQFSPKQLAAANPVNAKMGAANAGTLQLAGLKATGMPTALTLPPLPAPPATTGGGVTLSFTAGPPSQYTVTGSANSASNVTAPYTPGQPIAIDGWEITLHGAPKTGDTVTVGNATDAQYGDWYTRDAGNAKSLAALRDVKLFDGATLCDGFAGAMAQVGTRTQSAQYAADLSASIAANLERDRSAVSGVNLDEEAARLIQYQQAYQASAKMLQIAQNIFDNLIQGLGR